jgi:[protein-PII] uridylyltransferase
MHWTPSSNTSRSIVREKTPRNEVPVPDPTDHRSRFIATMPADYPATYSSQAIAKHQHLCERRGNALVEVGIFEQKGDLTGVCIIAPDRPGLLSLITEAFVVCGMDVVAGDAFTRDDNGLREAVDMFWLRLSRGQVFGDTHVEKLRATLLSLAEGYSTPMPPEVGSLPSSRSNSTVRFLEDANGALSTLEVETEDRGGLLLSLSRALYAQRVQIVRSEVRTKNGRVFDRFVIAELSGAPVGPLRRLEIQVSVLSAIEPAKRLASAPPPPLM